MTLHSNEDIPDTRNRNLNPSGRQAASGKRQANRSGDDTIKDTFEAIVIAFILAFVFRAYVVEAFVIPTGSMAYWSGWT